MIKLDRFQIERYLKLSIGPTSVFLSFLIFGLIIGFSSTHFSCSRNECFCENISSNGIFGQITNSWSSISFSIIAIWMSIDYANFSISFVKHNVCFLQFDEIPNSTRWFKNYIEPSFYILLVSFIGTFSFGMHATMHPPQSNQTIIAEESPEILDQISIHLYFSLVTSISISRFILKCNKWFYPTFLTMFFLMLLTLMSFLSVFLMSNGTKIYIYIVHVALFGGSEIARNAISRTPLNEMKYFASAVFFLSFSFGIWMLGKDGSEECDPESWFQAHAIWHVINAFATLLIWKHFKETLK